LKNKFKTQEITNADFDDQDFQQEERNDENQDNQWKSEMPSLSPTMGDIPGGQLESR
jgi:hypothetical protein